MNVRPPSVEREKRIRPLKGLSSFCVQLTSSVPRGDTESFGRFSPLASIVSGVGLTRTARPKLLPRSDEDAT